MQCATDACRVAVSTVVPALGGITAASTALAPVPAVRRIRDAKHLGAVNPVPYAFIYVNALIWIHYGLFIKDAYVIAPNLVGGLAGAWYLRSTYALIAKERQKLLIDAVAFAGAFSVFLIATVATLFLPADQGRTALGVLSIIILGAFYCSPLSELVTVVKTRNAAAFDPLLAATCAANGALWTVYGLAVGDAFIYGPNAAGAVFGLVQLAARAIFPARGVALPVHHGSGGAAAGSPLLAPSAPPHADPTHDGNNSHEQLVAHAGLHDADKRPFVASG